MISFRSRWLPALLLLVLALVASLAPEAFLLDRASLQEGQLWRLWTGHLVHHTAAHFIFDVGAAVFLTLLLRSARAWILLPPLVGLSALSAHPELASYAGLSGVLHGLTVLLGLRLAQEGRGFERVIAGGLLLGVAAKAVYEAVSGVPLFSGGFDMGGTTVHAAHLAGVVGGALLGARRVQPRRAPCYGAAREDGPAPSRPGRHRWGHRAAASTREASRPMGQARRCDSRPRIRAHPLQRRDHRDPRPNGGHTEFDPLGAGAP